MTSTGATPLDAAALEGLYGALEKPIYNVVYRWVWNREEARELVQEAFLRLWRMRQRVDPSTARPLVYRIALNLAANRRRRHRLWRWATLDPLREVSQLATAEPALDDALEGARRTQALQAAVEALPERLRRVITLCELGEMSYAEVAEVLQIPAGTVASRRNAAMTELRRLLEGRGRRAHHPVTAPEGS